MYTKLKAENYKNSTNYVKQLTKLNIELVELNEMFNLLVMDSFFLAGVAASWSGGRCFEVAFYQKVNKTAR